MPAATALAPVQMHECPICGCFMEIRIVIVNNRPLEILKCNECGYSVDG